MDVNHESGPRSEIDPLGEQKKREAIPASRSINSRHSVPFACNHCEIRNNTLLAIN